MGGSGSRQTYCHHRYHGNYGPTYFPTPSPYSANNGGSTWTAPGVGSQTEYPSIPDSFQSLEEVTDALAQAGLESSNLIVGVDFTKSNEWTGKFSFGRRSLHDMDHSPNPYEQAISIIGRTLSAFDEDNLIPCFGFGDVSSHDENVFSFNTDVKSCMGFAEVLQRYREIVPCVQLAGPTSFAPIIETAIGIVDNSGGQYHVLLIIADGQVTRSINTQPGHLSLQERATIDAIVRASNFPLSIVLVGVGDGPWDMMRQFDDNIPARTFDNFQFVNFTEITLRNIPQSRKEAEFALAALMEIPAQYKAAVDLQLLGRQRGILSKRCLPPPTPSNGSTNQTSTSPRTSSQERGAGITRVPYVPSSESAPRNTQMCPICLWQPRDLAFGCGHQTCCSCGRELQLCPICRRSIAIRIRLY
ncbi:hypothetical protein Taro_045876 [Colocasia esculenta]|uniref:RING-type domain-containing protein n=1 Tax=Colocasia esculenta TaxID=4460 RepID=A0A843X4U9_COLES|nr:hypothetical protein [Colocasia esculenta]